MKKLFAILFTLIVAFAATSITVFADCGPKDSVTVYVKGVENGREYYATLLSKNKSTGPKRAYTDNDPEYIAKQSSVWQAFYNYSQTDDYYYVQANYEMTRKNEFTWGYYPPKQFKILLYFPDDNSFIESEPLEHYAFHSNFAATVNDGAMTVSQGGGVKGTVINIIEMLVRMVITVLLELLVARAMGYCGKVETRMIIIVNVVTQIMLDAAILVGESIVGFLGGLIAYILLEFLIVLIEGIVYVVVFHIYSKKPSIGGAILYTFAANAASFFMGGFILSIGGLIGDFAALL